MMSVAHKIPLISDKFLSIISKEDPESSCILKAFDHIIKSQYY